MNKWIAYMVFNFVPLVSGSQVHGGIQQFVYTAKGSTAFVPKLYFETKTNWFAEARYNYEDTNTASLNAGHKFVFTKWQALSVSPFTGIVFGRFSGGNIGSNINVDCRKIFISLESQYSFCFGEKTRNYFYNWSEFGYQFYKYLYAGVAGQLTRCYERKTSFEPGVLVAATYKSWTFPMYAFNPAQKNRNYVLGLDWEWNYATPKVPLK